MWRINRILLVVLMGVWLWPMPANAQQSMKLVGKSGYVVDVNSSGSLEIEGTIGGGTTLGAAMPSTGLAICGSDGTNCVAFSVNASGQVNIAPLVSTIDSISAVPTGAATGGASGKSYISVGATEDEHAIKVTAGTLYSVVASNTNANEAYLRCEDDTAAGTAPGTDTPEFSIAIPGSASGAGVEATFPVGFAFANALTCWLVTGAAITDVAEVAANEIQIFYTYK